MNRNVMYGILKDNGMYAIFVHNEDHRTGYHTEFRLNKDKGQYDCTLTFDWGYVRHIESIHLCMNEMVLISRYSDMKVNVKYKHIKNFEIFIESEED